MSSFVGFLIFFTKTSYFQLKNMRSPLITISMESTINKLSVSQQHNLITIPLDNRNVRIFDVNGNRICRLSRDSHSRMVTCAAWLAQPSLFDSLGGGSGGGCSSGTTGGGGGGGNAAGSSSVPCSTASGSSQGSTSGGGGGGGGGGSGSIGFGSSIGSPNSLSNNSNSLSLFTCAFDRRVCAWSIVTETK